MSPNGDIHTPELAVASGLATATLQERALLGERCDSRRRIEALIQVLHLAL